MKIAARGMLLAACSAAWLTVALTSSPACAQGLASQIENSSRELAELRVQIADYRQELEALQGEEHDAAAKLDHLVQEMALLKNLLAGLDEREAMLQSRSEELQARLAEHQEDFARRQDTLVRHLRAIYMRGPQRNLELILTAGSFSDLVARLRFTTLAARLESGFMAETREEGQLILDEQRELQASLAGIWEAREEASQERRHLEDLDAERRAVLVALQRERATTESRLAELQANEHRLVQVLGELEARAHPAPPPEAADAPFARLAGNLEWPVVKTVTVHNGISLAAARGTPVYAVAAGIVEFADYLPGFGECVILDHGNGYYSLYAQLDHVYATKGGRVASGEVLAEVGEEPEEGGSQLYFEIRHGKTPLDPAGWLRPRR
jgi:septal ring factor EnvC (AmiA/AmiB activator)